MCGCGSREDLPTTALVTKPHIDSPDFCSPLVRITIIIGKRRDEHSRPCRARGLTLRRTEPQTMELREPTRFITTGTPGSEQRLDEYSERFLGIEPYVDADRAAEFLSLSRRRVLEMARAGILPGHPLGEGARRVWRFRLSELHSALSDKVNSNRQFPARVRRI